MPRLALSLPAELGPDGGTRSEGPHGATRPVTETRSVDASDAEQTPKEQPSIEQWLSCWAGGSRWR